MEIQVDNRVIKGMLDKHSVNRLCHCLGGSQLHWYSQEWETDMLTRNEGSYEDFAWQNNILTGGEKEFKEED